MYSSLNYDLTKSWLKLALLAQKKSDHNRNNNLTLGSGIFFCVGNLPLETE